MKSGRAKKLHSIFIPLCSSPLPLSPLNRPFSANVRPPTTRPDPLRRRRLACSKQRKRHQSTADVSKPIRNKRTMRVYNGNVRHLCTQTTVQCVSTDVGHCCGARSKSGGRRSSGKKQRGKHNAKMIMTIIVVIEQIQYQSRSEAQKNLCLYKAAIVLYINKADGSCGPLNVYVCVIF